MTYIVDQLFPPIKPDEAAAFEFSNFNYWRDPIPEIDLFLEDSANTTAGTATNSSSSSTLNNSAVSDNNSTLNAASHSKTLTTIPEN